MTTKNQTSECPKWAADLLDKLHHLEVRLGNIVETGSGANPKDAWHTRDLGDLEAVVNEDGHDGEPDAARRDNFADNVDNQDTTGSADIAEAIFDRVCAGLSEDGFSPQQIADIVNSRVGKGGRMKYCDANDVKEALEA
jgi:hypothetical protein